MEDIVNKIKELGKSKVKFIVLFGSHATNTATPLSDIDIAVYYNGDKEERYEFQLLCSGSLDNVDIKIFQDLPILLKNEVIQGKIIYSADYNHIFKTFLQVIREFQDFEKYYNESILAMKKRLLA